MRSIWKGEVSFGLVNVPVKVYSATEDHDLHARQVDKKDGVRIRYKKVRDDNGEEVEFSDIAKAYESEDGEMVILTKEDLASLPVEQSHEIEVTEFVPADQVDPVAFDNAYFLEPASRSNRAPTWRPPSPASRPNRSIRRGSRRWSNRRWSRRCSPRTRPKCAARA